MPKKINIEKTFTAIRKLPLTISLEQVEGWVYESRQGNKLLFHKPAMHFWKRIWKFLTR